MLKLVVYVWNGSIPTERILLKEKNVFKNEKKSSLMFFYVIGSKLVCKIVLKA